MLLAGPPASGQHTKMVNQILRSASAEFFVAHAPIRQISSLMRWLLEIESVYYVGTGYYSSPHISQVLPMEFPIISQFCNRKFKDGTKSPFMKMSSHNSAWHHVTRSA